MLIIVIKVPSLHAWRITCQTMRAGTVSIVRDVTAYVKQNLPFKSVCLPLWNGLATIHVQYSTVSLVLNKSSKAALAGSAIFSSRNVVFSTVLFTATALLMALSFMTEVNLEIATSSPNILLMCSACKWK